MENFSNSGEADGFALPASLLACSATNSFPPGASPAVEPVADGRLAEFAGELAALQPEVRDQVTQILDLVSRPMTVREIEHALRAAGTTTRSQRSTLARVLKGFSILAIVNDGGALHSTEGK